MRIKFVIKNFALVGYRRNYFNTKDFYAVVFNYSQPLKAKVLTTCGLPALPLAACEALQ